MYEFTHQAPSPHDRSVGASESATCVRCMNLHTQPRPGPIVKWARRTPDMRLACEFTHQSRARPPGLANPNPPPRPDRRAETRGAPAGRGGHVDVRAWPATEMRPTGGLRARGPRRMPTCPQSTAIVPPPSEPQMFPNAAYRAGPGGGQIRAGLGGVRRGQRNLLQKPWARLNRQRRGLHWRRPCGTS